eukprot:TRINITY_DN10989_c0_g2_i2.p1 TRINITY_DN10989_c0_g2~~TRINITY_DN10989_c0_g2_i2.p1  ORF type:complete len:188 (+),score=20.32 TRINITY_DN10989_c0_g2_i2:118-681(+)
MLKGLSRQRKTLFTFRTSYPSQILRSNKSLIQHLKETGFLTSQQVEEVISQVDRIHYVEDHQQAYTDQPQHIGDGQTISAPHMHVMALELLKDYLVPGAKVLDVGLGSGYLTACFGMMVNFDHLIILRTQVRPNGLVVGIDRIPRLVEQGKKNIMRANKNLLDEGTLLLVHGNGAYALSYVRIFISG